MNNINNETKIIKWIILLPIAGVILTSFILTNIFISSMHKTHNLELTNIEKNHINNLKNKIKERVENLSLLLNYNYEKEIKKEKAKVKDIVKIGFKKLDVIYNANKHLSYDEIYKKIDQELKDIRFFNGNGYYFVHTLDGTIVSLPANPKLVGTSIKNIVDKNGKNIYKSFKAVLQKTGQGFNQWYWNKLGSSKKLKKIGYVKKFTPLNLYIGTAVYLDDIKENISKNDTDFINTIDYKDDSYIFIMNTKGVALSHKNNSIIGIPLEKLDKKIQKNVQNIINKAISSNGTFIEYIQSENLFKTNKISKKISYIKHIPTLDWIIGTGLYTGEINQQIEKKRNELRLELENDIKTFIFVSTLVTFIVIILLILLSKKLKNIFQYYSENIEENNLKLKKLNYELEQQVKKQVSVMRQKDIILNQQSKLAAMGEMLGNIAHQWRQPLSAISTLASGIRVQKEVGVLDDAQLDKDLVGIVESTKILSNTIDDFRNFYSRDKSIQNFYIKNTVQKVLSLISANLTNHKIEVIQKIDEIELQSYENELIQVILNIINNAKDALQNEKKRKLIFIEASKKNNLLILKIYDNAGGIPNKIFNRVFEPYFTTKFKSQGTGIGLYMTKNIIDSSLNGKIEVENKEFSYENENYKGALFKIELPLSI